MTKGEIVQRKGQLANRAGSSSADSTVALGDVSVRTFASSRQRLSACTHTCGHSGCDGCTCSDTCHCTGGCTPTGCTQTW